MFTVKLPAFRTLPSLALAAIATVLICALLYYLPQRWHLGTPTLLPLTAVDRALSFLPWSGLLYFAAFPFLLGTFLSLRSFEHASRFLYACLVAQVIAMLVFLLWPTTYPRGDFPLPADAGGLAAALVAFCRQADLPLNCLPSLHVSTVTLCLVTQWHCTPGGKRAAPLLLPAGLAMIASTLTFKQHYLLDVIAGLVLGYASWWVCFRWRGLVLAR
ncbi:MAG: phosphatase PAP2 family protein [Steroidobacteraceae bacterium]